MNKDLGNFNKIKLFYSKKKYMLCKKNPCIRCRIGIKYWIENTKINRKYLHRESALYWKNLIKLILFLIVNKNRNIVNLVNKISIISTFNSIFSDQKYKEDW